MDAISWFQQLFRPHRFRTALGYSQRSAVLVSIGNVKLHAKIAHSTASVDNKNKTNTKIIKFKRMVVICRVSRTHLMNVNDVIH